MTRKRGGLFAQAWFWWRTLRLPWRKRFFVGQDLNGNTFWEFRLTARGPRAATPDGGGGGGESWRRIVDYPRSTPYSEIKVSPLWYQWLRHARPDAPSLVEQRNELLRQQRIKLLAAEADARWQAKPRLIDGPPAGISSLNAPGPARLGQGHLDDADQGESERTQLRREGYNDPWAKARRAQETSDNWQPAAWNPAQATQEKDS